MWKSIYVSVSQHQLHMLCHIYPGGFAVVFKCQPFYRPFPFQEVVYFKAAMNTAGSVSLWISLRIPFIHPAGSTNHMDSG